MKTKAAPRTYTIAGPAQAEHLSKLFVAVKASAGGTKKFLRDAAKAFEEIPSAENWVMLKAAMHMHQSAYHKHSLHPDDLDKIRAAITKAGVKP